MHVVGKRVGLRQGTKRKPLGKERGDGPVTYRRGRVQFPDLLSTGTGVDNRVATHTLW